MKTETEIKTRLKSARNRLIEVTKQFEKYDNHEDMEHIPVVEEEIKILMWVLEPGR